jgi:sugar/nucleoside kinase (ribokinase family)
MAERNGFVTGGTWCVDRNKLVTHWPGEDSIAEILSIETRNGGSASNLAIDMKRLDPAIFVETMGLVGDDDDGRYLIGEAEAYGIKHDQLVTTDQAATQFTDAFASQETGRRTHIFYQGAAAELTPDHFDLARTRGRFFHLGMPGIHQKMDGPWGDAPNGWVAVLREAKKHGLKTNLELPSVDAAVLARVTRPCLPHLDYLIVNDHEIGAIAGERTVTDGTTDVEACVRAAQAALDRGSMFLVAVHFPRGGVIVSREGGVLRRPSLSVPPSEVAASNGAGDAFAAGMLYGIHEGWTPVDALALAHAVAAASLRAMSTVEGVEPWRKCLELAERWGWRDPI